MIAYPHLGDATGLLNKGGLQGFARYGDFKENEG